ncbi:hypothetical protein BLNAU_2953 [Blattamonas nauphoetae]|uniref:Uncharacterized protein n=1 Tax=Blattamonas nauphoetae TaxID=2049346 RepID=A0ABQ9YDT7_9EUKA|nr:hypothetical protein BLNAU_2953 [Blattamonas nauphoetae]
MPIHSKDAHCKYQIEMTLSDHVLSPNDDNYGINPTHAPSNILTTSASLHLHLSHAWWDKEELCISCGGLHKLNKTDFSTSQICLHLPQSRAHSIGLKVATQTGGQSDDLGNYLLATFISRQNNLNVKLSAI